LNQRAHHPSAHVLALGAGLIVGGLLTVQLAAQGPLELPVYHPLDHHAPPGAAARWSAIANREAGTPLQFARIVLPSTGHVSVYHAGDKQPLTLESPAQLHLGVGYTFRLKIDGMPEFPGIELYPTLEVLDHLHPPPGRETQFPVPIEFSFEELQLALNNRLVTKVIYLEQPELASPLDFRSPLSPLTLEPNQNLLAEADRRGRPVALIRLGGRLPDPHRPEPGFFGAGGPVRVPLASPDAVEAAPSN
jgi:hypothetical protein